MKGDRQGKVERLYREHGDLVLRRARRIMANEADAQEVLQELFMSIVQKPEQLDGKTAITGWLYAATTHLCLNTLRNRRNRVRILAQEPPPVAVTDGPEHAMTAQQLLAQLPEELARIAIYYYFDEMTHEEISELVGCSRRHVGNLLQQVNERMQASA